MLCTIAMSVLKLPVHPPNRAMPYVKASVGTMLGASVTLGVLTSLLTWWPSFLFMAAVMIAGGICNFHLMRRAFAFGRAEAALCAVPGGITEMILLSEITGGEQWRVAIVHALRIALAILIIPVLIGLIADAEIVRANVATQAEFVVSDWAWFGFCILAGVVTDRFKSFPAGLILVPLALCAVLHLIGVANFSVPAQISNLLQIFIGINVGARFIGVAPKLLLQVGLAALAVVMVQISLAFGSALIAAEYLGADPLALTLAYAPGGLAEMSLIAVAVGQDIAIVGFHHIARVLGALFAGPIILKFTGQDKA
ncbi:AbrB family transcriptional regulator [Cognatishimia sp. WU-CL00825]